MQKLSDAELVRMTLRGDGDAYGELVSRYKNMIYGAAYGIVSDYYSAEDIAQNAFVDGFMQLSRLYEPEKFAPWIYGIAKRKAQHFIARRKVHTDIDEMAEILYTDAASPEDEFIRKERALAVRTAFSALSEKNRVVAALFYFNGLSVAEIAQRLSLPQGTVKSRLYEARAKLKGELAYMKESDQGLPPEFEEVVRERITQLRLYYRDNGNTENYEKLYADTEQFIAAQPESASKQSALADLYSEKLRNGKNDAELEKKLRDAAEAGGNGMALCGLFIDDIIKGSDYAVWIKRLDQAILRMEQMRCDEGKGQLLFWRGAANIHLRHMDEAISDFTESKRLCPDSNIYNTLAVTALKLHKLLITNADDPYLGFDVTAESYQKVGTKIIFTGQPGFSGNNNAMWERHRMKYINYFVSRFDNTFFDTSMETGKTCMSKSGNAALTLIGYNESVTVAAGRFDNCMHLYYSCPADYDADIWYAGGTGLVKVLFSGNHIDGEEYELAEYDIKGGSGYFPFCTGNRWNYIKSDLPEYLYRCFENEVIWTDGERANVSVIHSVTFKKNYLTECRLDSDIYISLCDRFCDEWKLDEAIEMLQKAVRENSSQNAATAALGGIEYLNRFSEYQKKGYRFCPSSYNASYLSAKDGRIMYNESGVYSFGPYRWGSRFEENRIFGVKPFRYLQDLTGRIWDKKWVPGYTEKKTDDDWKTDIFITVEDGGTITVKSGTFENCVRVVLDVEIPEMTPGYYFDGYRYVWCGRKEYWFARGAGIVRFDCIWGDCLRSSSELASYANPTADDSYMPLSLGCMWEYDETNLTGEGYRARRILKVACGMNGKYLTHDMQEFLWLGTEDAYEAYKAKQIK